MSLLATAVATANGREMRSSFTRRAPSSVDSGTRPGLHGQTLISLGLVDLDRLLGGGLPLGSLLLVTEVTPGCGAPR